MNSFVDKPIVILSAPRAGSTLLFETLALHPQVSTIGGESHAIIEHVPELSTVARGYVSNRLNEEDATEGVKEKLIQRFLAQSRDYKGTLKGQSCGGIRLLEKTPKNCLRVAFLNAVFPDAKFIYLVREPKENISSIMQAWKSKRFVTYPDLPGRKGGWSLFLPEAWETLREASLAEIASYQWRTANDNIISSLASIEEPRSMIVNYSEFVSDPKSTLNRILAFAELERSHLDALVGTGLKLSRYTLTKPKANKWHANAQELLPQIPKLNGTIDKINKLLENNDCQLIKKTTETLTDIPSPQIKSVKPNSSLSSKNISRNSQCPCGSGKRYKQCHGLLN